MTASSPIRRPHLALLCLSAALGASGIARAEPATRVFLNGRPAPVYFNDGDSFRVLGGPLAGSKARLAGYNTLESYGPVHQWGGWHAKELYALSKAATQNAARGTWRCTSNMDTDTYGRILWFCPDLAEDQIRKGLAHAISVNEEPSDPRLLEAQRDAIANRRGIWAHGVPEYVMTSLHSITEGGGASGRTYNRLVSVRDGHSASMEHKDKYEECQTVCNLERPVTEEQIGRAAEQLRALPELAEALKTYGPRLPQLVADWSRLGWFVGVKDKEAAGKLDEAMKALDAAGAFGKEQPHRGSCVVYVEFERRYGSARAACLR